MIRTPPISPTPSTGAIAGSAAVTAAELADPPVAELLQGERLRTVSLESRLLLAAARRALRDAGPGVDADDLGVVVATRHAGLQEYVDLYRSGTEGERPRVRPARGPQTGLTAPAAEISIRLPAAGPNATVCNGAVGGLDALRYAADRLACGDAAAMLVCEVDLVPEVVRGPEAAADGADAQQRATVVVLERADAPGGRGGAPRALVGAVATAFSPSGDAAEAEARAVGEVLAAGDLEGGDGARTWNGDGGLGTLARLAAAAASLARGEAHGPQLLRAQDAGAAGAAVLHPEAGGAR